MLTSSQVYPDHREEIFPGFKPESDHPEEEKTPIRNFILRVQEEVTHFM